MSSKDVGTVAAHGVLLSEKEVGVLAAGHGFWFTAPYLGLQVLLSSGAAPLRFKLILPVEMLLGAALIQGRALQ